MSSILKEANTHVKRVLVGTTTGKEVDIIELSLLFGTSTRTLMKYIKMGMPFISGGKGDKYVFDTAACYRWRVQKEQDDIYKAVAIEQAHSQSEVMTGAQAKTRKEIAQALTAELDLETKREKLANIEDCLVNFASALVNVRAALVSQSSRLSGLLSHQDEEQIAIILDKDAETTLKGLSEYDHQYIRNESES